MFISNWKKYKCQCISEHLKDPKYTLVPRGLNKGLTEFKNYIFLIVQNVLAFLELGLYVWTYTILTNPKNLLMLTQYSNDC